MQMVKYVSIAKQLVLYKQITKRQLPIHSIQAEHILNYIGNMSQNCIDDTIRSEDACMIVERLH